MLLADIVLIAWAMGLLGGDDEASSKATKKSTSASSSPSFSAARADGARLLLEAYDDEVAWRASSVLCDAEDEQSSTEVERTDDGGETWETSDLEGRTVLRLRMTSESQGFAVVADESCEPAVVSTTDGGESWSEPGEADSTWSLWPEGGPEVLVPGGEPVAACEDGSVTSLSVAGAEGAYVLCQGSTVRRTTDGGQTWTDVAAVDDAVALSVREGTLAVLVETDRCEGLGVRTGEVADDLSLRSKVSCAEGPTVPASIALLDEGGWVSGGESTTVTEDLTDWTSGA